MKLEDIKDDNGTPLQEYATLLAEKCKSRGLTFIFFFIHKPSKAMHVLTSVDMAALPSALKELVHQMRKPHKGETEIALTDAEPS